MTALAFLHDRVTAEVAKVVRGQDHVVRILVAAAAVGGHILLEGVPGVGKTLVAHATARALGLSFKRAQFTPDMLPADLTGTMTLRGGELTFRPGPVFTNVLLADEINRTTPKTQAALLEAMQESQVTVDGEPHALPEPFVVVATQNPLEFEGTYPLPEAQLDRFLAKVDVAYPTLEAEVSMVGLPRHGLLPATLDDVQAVASADTIAQARAEVDSTGVHPAVAAYVVAVVRATRQVPSVAVGASPRAGVHLLGAARAWARLQGREFVTPDDISELAQVVLSHRLILQPEAELEGYQPATAIASALASVPVPR